MTLPQRQHAPTITFQRGRVLLVTNPCSRELWFPVPEIGLGKPRNRAIRVGMPMPEATVDEDHRSVARKDQVGLTRHVAPMQSETVSKAVHH